MLRAALDKVIAQARHGRDGQWTGKMGYQWLLRERMAEQGMWKTTDLAPLLADRGIHLSAAQIYRLVSGTPRGCPCRSSSRSATSSPARRTT